MSISPHTTPERPTPGESITIANGDSIPVTGVTRANIDIPISSKFCVPDAYRSLLSVGQACDDGDIDDANINIRECKLYKNGRLIAIGDRKRGGLYELCQASGTKTVNLASASVEQWHQRLAHSPLPVIKEIVSKQAATGIELNKGPANQRHKCEACELGKVTRLPFTTRDPEHRAKQPGRVIHTDLCGPMQTESIQGSRYAMPVVDDYSRFVTEKE